MKKGLPWWLSGKESACQAGGMGSIPGSERSPGEGNVTHSSILAGESHRQRSLVGCSLWGHKRVGHDLVTKQQQQDGENPYQWENLQNCHLGYGEGDGTPLQSSCLENPMDGGPW